MCSHVQGSRFSSGYFPENKKTLANPRGLLAGVPGLEPRMAEPESAVLPITPHPNLAWRSNSEELFVVPPTGFEPVLAP